MNKKRKLRLSKENIRALGPEWLNRAVGGIVACSDTYTAATDGNNGCPSEATGCHTGYSGCGSC